MTLTTLANQVHQLAVDKGWHSFEETEDQYIARLVSNLHAEVSELWEAHREGRLHAPCDKNMAVQLACVEEELADIMIRTLDAASRLNVDIEAAVLAKHAYNKTRPYRHGGKKA